MPLEIIRNDISKVRADAIVNTANPRVAIGAGVDEAIYKAAGEDLLLAARAEIGPMAPGEVASTPAFGLDAKYIIHTVGPAWEGGSSGEVETVAKCYRGALKKAAELGCVSIAFPLISSGTYGFPKDVALKTAIAEISAFLLSDEMQVYLVVYDKESFVVSGKIFSDIRTFIDERDVKKVSGSERYHLRRLERSAGRFDSNSFLSSEFLRVPGLSPAAPSGKARLHYDILEEAEESSESIEEAISNREETFQEYLLRIIDRKGLKDPEVYKKANIDRKLFSKIRGNVNYQPSKRTALALAIALRLNLDETKDLLLKAGIALSRSAIFDIIIEYCIEHGVYDIYEINCILFKYEQPMLGA